MFILVEDLESNIVFQGEADDFLYKNDNDIDLENLLDDLERQDFGDSVNVDNDGTMLTITKVDELIY